MKNWKDVPKPPGVAELETDERGYPIFFAIQPPKGRPLDFRVLNVRNHVEIANKNLCAICGKKNGYWLSFIGGPMCIKGPSSDGMRTMLDHDEIPDPQGSWLKGTFGIFGDGPMHRECAEYAMQVCPYLTIRSMNYKKEPSEKVPGTIMDKNVILKKPRYMLLATVRKYRMEPAPGGKPVFRTAPPKRAEFFGWPDSKENGDER